LQAVKSPEEMDKQVEEFPGHRTLGHDGNGEAPGGKWWIQPASHGDFMG